MALAYIYNRVSSTEAPSILLQKIHKEIGVAPDYVQRPNFFVAYIEFAAPLPAARKAELDDMMDARGGVFAATDNTPAGAVGIIGIGRSPDGSYWKVGVNNAGTMITSKLV